MAVHFFRVVYLLILSAGLIGAAAQSVPNLQKARIEVYQSNTLGMAGQLLKQAEQSVLPATVSGIALQKALRATVSPPILGDTIAKSLVKSLVGTVTGRWLLFRVVAHEGTQSKRWNRLLDYEKDEGFLLVQTIDASGMPSTEETYKQGILKRRTELNPKGNPIQEYYYLKQQPSTSGGELGEESNTTAVVLDELRTYRYEKGRPVEFVASDAEGKKLYTVKFSYTLQGSIRQTEKTFADGSKERFLYRYGVNGVTENWQDGPLEGNRWQYDTQGRIINSEDWEGNELISSLVTVWAAEQGSIPSSREMTDFKSKVNHVEVFDASGHLVQSDEKHDGELYRRTSQVWDPEGNIVLRSILTEGREEAWAWEYEKGILARQRYSKEGLPVTVINYQDKDRVEELYLDGKPILRVFYHDSVRYKEEELRDGNVTRTRTLKK